MNEEKDDKRSTTLVAAEEKRLPPEIIKRREDFYDYWNTIEREYNTEPTMPKETFTLFLDNCRYWILRFRNKTTEEDSEKLSQIETIINTWYKNFPEMSANGYGIFKKVCVTLSDMFKKYKIDDVLLEDAILWG